MQTENLEATAHLGYHVTLVFDDTGFYQVQFQQGLVNVVTWFLDIGIRVVHHQILILGMYPSPDIFKHLKIHS